MPRARRPAARGRFDFAALERRIVAASRKAVDDVARAHPEERICAVALYSDEGAMTVCPAFDLASALADRTRAHPSDAAYLTFSPAEWALESVGAEAAFDAICTKVRTHVLANRGPFAAFKAELFETCLRALEQLRDAGVFARWPGVLLMFAVSDADLDAKVEIARLVRLNGRSTRVAEYRAWARTWARGR